MSDEALRCPDCEVTVSVIDRHGEVPASVEDGVIRVAIDCPDCGAPLAITIECALPDALGADLSVVRRETGEWP